MQFLTTANQPGKLFLNTPKRKNAYVVDVSVPGLTVVKTIDIKTSRSIDERWFWGIEKVNDAKEYAKQQAINHDDL